MNEVNIRILINEDDPTLRATLANYLEPLGYECQLASNGKEGLRIFVREQPDIVLTDLDMTPVDGFEFLRRAKDIRPSTPMLVISGIDSEEHLMSALRLGATEIIKKPVRLDSLDSLLRSTYYSSNESESVYCSELIGQSPQIRSVRSMLRKLSRVGHSTILIFGESGTGKEVAAREIHQLSRSQGAFVPFNCALSDGGLIENALFGHERGAFTDAKTREKGLLEAANGGTLFLDEIGEMHIEAQAKLLRFLETSSFRRLGGHEEVKVETRVIAATHRDLTKMVREYKFREDLFFRLNVLPITLPSLRERGEDLFLLADYFLQKTAQRLQLPRPQLSPSVRELLSQYHWPGNIRELRNLMERFVLVQEGLTVDLEDLPPELAESGFELSASIVANELQALGLSIASDTGSGFSVPETAGATPGTNLFELSFGEARKLFETNYFHRLLEIHAGNVASVARASGLDPSNLRRTLKRLNLDPTTYRS